MKEFWDQRYGGQEYVYGQEPNEYLRTFLDTSQPVPGRILLPGEGEGRNAVYAARKGWQVEAFDQSQAGREKALRLAEEQGVSIRYTVCDILHFPFQPAAYDLIGLFFFHLPRELRNFAHAQFIESLKPGGMIVAEFFSPLQIGKPSGGPQTLDLLYDAPSLRQDFHSLEILHLSEQTIILNEGPYHQGEAEVVRLIAQKPSHGTL